MFRLVELWLRPVLLCPYRLLDPAVEAGGQTLRFGRSLGEHPRRLSRLGLAGYLEGEDDRFFVFEAEFPGDGPTHRGDLVSRLGGDLAARQFGIELLADLDAAAHAPLPPPRG